MHNYLTILVPAFSKKMYISFFLNRKDLYLERNISYIYFI